MLPTYYFAANGNDNNNGTFAAPFKTVAKANTLNGNLLFKAGDTFAGSLTIINGGTLPEPLLVSSYNQTTGNPVQGAGALTAILNAGDATGTAKSDGTAGDGWGIRIKNNSYITVSQLKFQGSGVNIVTGASTSGSANGSQSPQNNRVGVAFDIVSDTSGATLNTYTPTVSGLTGSGKQYKGITIDRVEGTGFYQACYIRAEPTVGGTNADGFDSVAITNSRLHDCLHFGIYALGGNSAQVDPTDFHFYLGRVHSNLTVTNCEVGNIPGDPNNQIATGVMMQINNCIRAEIGNNYVHDGTSLCGKNFPNIPGGGGGIIPLHSDYCHVFKNEVCRLKTLLDIDACAFDADMDTHNCTFEFNYSHDNDGPACQFIKNGFYNEDSYYHIYRYNLSVNDCRNDHARFSLPALFFLGQTTLMIYGNTIIMSEVAGAVNQPSCTTFANRAEVMQLDNVFITSGAATFVGPLNSNGVPRWTNGNGEYIAGNNYFSLTGTPSWVYGGATYTTLAAFRAAVDEGGEILQGVAKGGYGNPMLRNAGKPAPTLGLNGNFALLTAYQPTVAAAPIMQAYLNPTAAPFAYGVATQQTYNDFIAAAAPPTTDLTGASVAAPPAYAGAMQTLTPALPAPATLISHVYNGTSGSSAFGTVASVGGTFTQSPFGAPNTILFNSSSGIRLGSGISGFGYYPTVLAATDEYPVVLTVPTERKGAGTATGLGFALLNNPTNANMPGSDFLIGFFRDNRVLLVQNGVLRGELAVPSSQFTNDGDIKNLTVTIPITGNITVSNGTDSVSFVDATINRTGFYAGVYFNGAVIDNNGLSARSLMATGQPPLPTLTGINITHTGNQFAAAPVPDGASLDGLQWAVPSNVYADSIASSGLLSYEPTPATRVIPVTASVGSVSSVFNLTVPGTDTTAPVIASVTINANGVGGTVVFSELCKGLVGLTLAVAGMPITPIFTGDGQIAALSRPFAVSGVIYQNQAVTYSYSGDGITDAGGNHPATVTNQAAVNNSTIQNNGESNVISPEDIASIALAVHTRMVSDPTHKIYVDAFGNVKSLAASVLSIDEADLNISSRTLNKKIFFSSGREVLKVDIVAEGRDMPNSLLATPMFVGFTAKGASQPPAINDANGKMANVFHENGHIFARLFVGVASGITSPELPIHTLVGSADGTEYDVWVVLRGLEIIPFKVDTLTVY